MQKAGKLASMVTVLISLAFMVQGCEKEGGDVSNISKNNANESHNAGKNCMQCHVSGGEGKGWFQAAGTVYNSAYTAVQPNGVVKLFTGPDGTGTLKATIQVDAKGNFFTTEAIDFTGGLYPKITGTSGTSMAMGSSITMGQCNSCHGVSTNKIFVN
jgi:hypothetical protein